ncbi:MAG: class I SAM-dependent methyltransferase [Proteobacteria bacterium]|nr:class I SAM-dependent methyltransferase [Burkholderiales bacterium]
MNPARRRSLAMLARLAAASGWLGVHAAALRAQSMKPLERTGGPYVPTPWSVVDQMIRMAEIGPKDLVMDLGSGDGRLVIAAAQRHGARGYGVDIDPELIKLATANAQKEGVAPRVRFEQRDIFDTDVREATVLTLYLLPAMMTRLRPKMMSELRAGSRIVAHDYPFDEWRPDSQITFDVPEKVAITGIAASTVYLWIVPARLEGRWQISAPVASGFDRAEVMLRQTFQDLTGTLVVDKRAAQRLDATSLRGQDFRFAVPVEGRAGRSGRAIFRGRIEGGRIEGTIESTLAGDVRFRASPLL